MVNSNYIYPTIQNAKLEYDSAFWRLTSFSELEPLIQEALERFNIKQNTWYIAEARGDGDFEYWNFLKQNIDNDDLVNGLMFIEFINTTLWAENSVEDRLWHKFSKKEEWGFYVRRNILNRIKYNFTALNRII